MSEDPASIVKATRVLRVASHKVKADVDFGRWWVNEDRWLTEEELLRLAVKLGLMTHPGKV